MRALNVHLESGRENSLPREHQLNRLFSYVRSEPWSLHDDDIIQHDIIDASIVLGDINPDPSYPENLLVVTNSIDIWETLRSNKSGFMEDTCLNQMRFQFHGRHKQARFDRILLVPKSLGQPATTVHPGSIDLLGKDPIDKEGKRGFLRPFGVGG